MKRKTSLGALAAIAALVAAPGFDLKPVEPRAGFAQPARPRDPPKWTRKGPHQGSREMARRRGELGWQARGRA